jgi:ubiquinone/menaquinone biosynthesis C-methylase UbiE
LAFKDLGCFAVGIDLNPGDRNLHVLYGDFHHLQFPDHSVDHVFTNALDHVFDLSRVIEEIRRVMSPQGTFIAEIVRGSRDVDGREPGEFESYWWDSADEVVDFIKRHAFQIDRRDRFFYPWRGDSIVFRQPRESS